MNASCNFPLLHQKNQKFSGNFSSSLWNWQRKKQVHTRLYNASFLLGEFCVDKMCSEKSNSIDLKDYNI